MKLSVRNALVIPQKATYELQDKVYVFIVDKNNKIHSRNITVKFELPNLYVVDSGLEAGDTILLDGLQAVKDDQKIKPVYVTPSEVVNKLQLINE